ncbi:hypothetical protein ACRW6G_27690, partial [Escherichia coli]
MSNTSYKQIIPATDWYFRHDNVSGVAGKSTVYQLAAWALKENGEVVGLVTVRDDNGRPKRHCCKVSDEAAFCLIQRPYISKTLLTRRISPRG